MSKEKKCTVIAVAAQKGGVSKTTAALNIGVALQLLNMRVLLIDLDGQCSLTQHFDKTDAPTILHAIETKKLPISRTLEGVDIVPADPNTPINENLAKVGTLKALVDDVRAQYDFVIIDTSPSVSWLHFEAMRACDYVIIPSLVSGYGIEGVKAMYKYLDDAESITKHKTKVLGVLLSMCNNQKTIHKFYRESFQHEFGVAMFKTMIPQCVSVEESFVYRQSVIKYAPKCKATTAFKELAQEIINRLENTLA